MKQIESGCFDAVYLNFNFADWGAKRKVLPAAGANGLPIISREAFMKGALFKMGDEVGFADRRKLAQVGIKWNLSHAEVGTVVVGTNNPNHFESNLEVLKNLKITEEEEQIINKIKTATLFKACEERKTREFFEEK
jgi:predicted aldo/keto reductase-like oxidoreductase